MKDTKKQSVVLDVMGADGGAEQIILGGLDAAAQIGDNLQLVLVGHRDIIEKTLAQRTDVPANI